MILLWEVLEIRRWKPSSVDPSKQILEFVSGYRHNIEGKNNLDP